MNKIISFFVFSIIFIFQVSAFSAQSAIYIYNDDGVSVESLKQVLTTINKATAGQYDVKTINAKEVIDGTWAQQAVLFILPGGADIPYVKKLQGKGNDNIKHFVKNGGGYLGFCAGSYYASSYVEFDKGGEYEVMGKRELAFFPGKAIGPFLAPYHYQNNSGARAALIQTYMDGVKPELAVYYNGGGYFEHAENYPNVNVLARYANAGLPAIIYIKYGEGHVVLSGVHFEYDPVLLDKKDVYLRGLIPELKKDNLARELLVERVLQLVLPTKGLNLNQ